MSIWDTVKHSVKNVVPDNYHDLLGQACKGPRHAWYPFKRYIQKKRLVVVVGSSHRVGSTWLFSLLKDLGCFEGGTRSIPAQFLKFGTISLEPKIFDHLRSLQGYRIFKSHSLPPVSKKLANNVKLVSICRDPRDVLVSSSFYIAHLAEEKGGWGQEFRKQSNPERIKALMEKSDLLVELEQWFRTPFAYKIRYEDLKTQPAELLKGVLNYIGLTVDKKVIEKVILKHSFETKSGRKSGEENQKSPMRKGITGDWRNYFNQELIFDFKTAKKGRWNQLLVEMEYENRLDWE